MVVRIDLSQLPPPTLHVWQLRGEAPRLGLLAALAHAATAAAGFLAWHHSSSRCWLLIAIILAALSVDRCLGLLARLCRLIRMGLRQRGNYWTLRRPVQWLASLCVIFLAVASIRFGLGTQIGAAQRLAWFAAVFLATFVLLRSLSLHEFDGLLYRRRRLPDVPLSFVIEISADMMILTGMFLEGWLVR
jgi:hypothetical protein